MCVCVCVCMCTYNTMTLYSYGLVVKWLVVKHDDVLHCMLNKSGCFFSSCGGNLFKKQL